MRYGQKIWWEKLMPQNPRLHSSVSPSFQLYPFNFIMRSTVPSTSPSTMRVRPEFLQEGERVIDLLLSDTDKVLPILYTGRS